MEKVGRGNKVRQATLGKRGKRGQDSARPTDRSALLPLPKGRTSPNSLDLSLYIPAALTTLANQYGQVSDRAAIYDQAVHAPQRALTLKQRTPDEQSLIHFSPTTKPAAATLIAPTDV